MKLQRVGAVVAVALLVSVAGCAQLLTQEETAFVANEANVTQADAEKAAYSHNATEWQNVTRSVEAAGQEREVTVSNRAEVFVNRSVDGSPAATVTVVSSPTVTVAGQELNPVAEWSQRDALGEFAGQFDPYDTITDIEERETREVRMLGTDADMRVFNATLERETGATDDVVVGVVTVEHEGDYVVAIAVRGIDDAEQGATAADTETLLTRIEH